MAKDLALAAFANGVALATQPLVVWGNSVADVAISASYAIICSGLAWAMARLRRVPHFAEHLLEFTIFGILLVFCSTTRLAEALAPWWPLARVTLAIKSVWALLALPAAGFFLWRLPAMTGTVIRLAELVASFRTQTEALRKSEAFLDRTGQLAGIGGWELDLATQQVTWSSETCRIHGVSLDFAPTLAEGLAFYTEEARPIITAAVQRAMATGEGWDLELAIVRRDGRQVWVRCFGIAEFRDGKPVRIAGAFQDISARVEERLALQQANERVALATQSGRIGIWEWDIARNSVDCDDAMHRLHGIELGTHTNDVVRWREFIHPDDRDYVMEALTRAVEQGEPYDTEYRILWSDGSLHTLRSSAQVTRDSQGRAMRMAGANWDVTEARHLTAELARQHELLRITLESIGDGVITTDAQANVVWLNPVAERMTGWSTAQAAGRPLVQIFRIFNHYTREAVKNPVVECLRTGAVSKLAPDTVLLGRTGKRFDIDDSAAPMIGGNGEILGAILVFHDVSEQRRLFLETTRVAKVELKLKDDFLSRVSHELRSPLTSIYSFSSIIADDLAGETTPQQQEYLQIVLKNVAQLRSMIEDLLTVTQANEGKLGIEPARLALSEPVQDALDTISGPASRKGIELSRKCCATLPAAFADPTRVLQTLIILLDNAVKFTPEGGRIAVHVSHGEPGFLRVDVADTGCGIPAEKRAKVFEHLYQITGPHDADTSRNGRNGLGLGLHIAKDLVTRQGGQIWITDAAGQGSVFSFTVPVFAHQHAAEAHAADLYAAASPVLLAAERAGSAAVH